MKKVLTVLLIMLGTLSAAYASEEVSLTALVNNNTLTFDASELPENAVITSATLNLTGRDTTNGVELFEIRVMSNGQIAGSLSSDNWLNDNDAENSIWLDASKLAVINNEIHLQISSSLEGAEILPNAATLFCKLEAVDSVRSREPRLDTAAISAISAGYAHTAAVTTDGSVWTWGNNRYGQLGIGTTTDSPKPVKVTGLSGVIAVAAGSYHTAAVTTDGSVWTWGYNQSGQLGIGTSGDAANSSTPVKVTGLSGVVAVAAGYYHTVAVTTDGSVYTWGYNYHGQLGIGTSGDAANSSTPVKVTGLSGVAAVAAGYGLTAAVTIDGSLYTWGYNYHGQLGNGTTTDSSKPVKVTGLSGVASVAAGGGSHTVAVTTDGSVWTWGKNRYLGIGSTANSSTPVKITTLSSITSIAAGWTHTVALKADGSVWTWGYNDKGQLGTGTAADGTTPDRTTPVKVTALSGVAAIAAYGSHTVALKTDNSLLAWGSNEFGQLGNGLLGYAVAPVQTAGLTGVSEVKAGGSHTVAVTTDGSIYTWGYGGNGQLGNGTAADGSTPNSSKPVKITGLSGVSAVAAGWGHTAAVTTDGSVWTWGLNNYGQLGNGTTATTPNSTPIKVGGLSGVSAVAAGDSHTAAVTTDGSVYTWGRNSEGQLGIGTTADSSKPVKITGLSGVVAIAAGGYHTTALTADGSVWTWGLNNYGQLGNGTAADGSTPNSSKPLKITGLSGVVAIAAGGHHTVALTADGSVWGFGQNLYGHLGNGLFGYSTSPVQVLPIGSTGTAPSLTLSSSSGAPGQPVTVNLTLANVTGTALSAISTDIAFDSNVLETPSAVIGTAGTAAGKTITTRLINGNLFRVGVLGTDNNNAVGNGVIASVTFKIKSTAANGAVVLTHSATGSTTGGADMTLNAAAGTITVNSCTLLGDCNCDQKVSIAEIQSAINMYLGTSTVKSCCDRDNNGVVSIGEVQTVINNFLGIVSSSTKHTTREKKRAAQIDVIRTGDGYSLNLISNKNSVSAVSVDVEYSVELAGKVSFSLGGSAQSAGKELVQHEIKPGVTRIAIISMFDNQTIEDGEILSVQVDVESESDLSFKVSASDEGGEEILVK